MVCGDMELANFSLDMPENCPKCGKSFIADKDEDGKWISAWGTEHGWSFICPMCKERVDIQYGSHGL